MTPAEFKKKWSRYTGKESSAYPRLELCDADYAAKLKKRALTNLYSERLAWLDLALNLARAAEEAEGDAREARG